MKRDKAIKYLSQLFHCEPLIAGKDDGFVLLSFVMPATLNGTDVADFNTAVGKVNQEKMDFNAILADFTVEDYYIRFTIESIVQGLQLGNYCRIYASILFSIALSIKGEN